MTAAQALMVNARGCDVCGSRASSFIHEQRFCDFDDGSALAGYRVVSCSDCGFFYADGIPPQRVFDRYYREMSKYEPADEERTMSPTMRTNYEDIVREISERLPERTVRILDVGSASGDLLSIFKNSGYTSVTGLDPSPRCADIALRRHGIRVVNATVSEMQLSDERFDLIMLAGVLEHIRDLHAVVAGLKPLLAEHGHFWFAVPDASRFASFVESPFQHFSIEHINFFTKHSLSRLLDRHGFSLRSSWHTVHRLGAMSEPIVNAIFGAAGTDRAVAYGAGAENALHEYVRSSERLENDLLDAVAPLARSREPIVVWGTGSLTMHLMTEPRFAELNILAFVDSNRNYWGKTIRGVPVIRPDDMRQRSEPVLLASYSYEGEMRAQIRDAYHLPNRVIPLFELARRRAADSHGSG